MFKKILSLCAIALITLSAPAFAQDAPSEDPAYLSFGIGIYDIFNGNEATDLRLEYRHNDPVLWIIKPYMGAEITTDGSAWGGAGLYADLKATENVYVTPSWGVGLYRQGSSDLDLDHAIEFKTQLEAGYEFHSGRRIGAAISHISNADLGDQNPGTEVLNVYYHTPISSLF